MPFAIVVTVLVAEILAFFLSIHLVGFGWTLLALAVCMLIGMFWGQMAMRSTLATAARNAKNPARLASDFGITVVGLVLASAPGFVTFIIGVFLLFPPTRAFVRAHVALRLSRKVEKFGADLYRRSPMARRHTSYGSFDQSIIVDEDSRE